MPETPTPYITRQEVREEAGFQHVEELSTLNGVMDGSNKTFMTEHKPIVDRNHDDEVTIADVTVYVDGSPVVITSVDAETGVIVLENAPADDVILQVFYHHSQLTDYAVDGYIRKASGVLHRCLRTHGITVPFSSDDDSQAPYMDDIQHIITLHAGGLALIRDYGSNADTEETSKDGYKKLELAKSEIESICNAIMNDPLIPNNGSDGNGGTLEVSSRGHIFGDGGGLVNGERQGFGCGDSHEDFFRK